MRAALVILLALTAACGAEPAVNPGEDSGVADAGAQDAGAPDAGTDTGQPDAGMGDVDAGVNDGGSGSTDAGAMPPDAGQLDGGLLDAGSPDAGTTDAGPNDAGPLDAGLPDAGTVCSRCVAYRSPVNAGVVQTAAVSEISGLAASRLHPGVLYAHNDSGGLPVLYAFSTTGLTLGELQLAGAVNLDWEDLSIGPCPAGSCLYIADIGDNGANRATPYYVYRVAEPSTPPSGAATVTWERFELQYPAGLRSDAEALMVHPVTGDVYVVTKRQSGKSAAYKATAPLSASSANVMTKVADLAVPDGLDLPLTGGDIDPCGSAILLRSYSAIYQFSGSGPFDSLFTSPFTRVPAPAWGLGAADELQGEAITWLPGGGYLTVSEGLSPTLHRVDCQ